MKLIQSMRRHRGLGVVLGLLALTAAGAANATCMMTAPQHDQSSSDPTTFVPAVYHPGSASSAFVKTNYGFEADPGIVGLWQFKFYVGTNLVDWGTQAWHSDGTELMFSGGQNPETGDVCQGAWRQIGRSTFALNHIAMSWGQPGGPFGVRVHFHVTVNLNNSGTAFTGHFTQQAYAVSSADPFAETSPLGPLVTGTVVATRVIPD